MPIFNFEDAMKLAQRHIGYTGMFRPVWNIPAVVNFFKLGSRRYFSESRLDLIIYLAGFAFFELPLNQHSQPAL